MGKGMAITTKKRDFHVGVKLWIATETAAGVFGEGKYQLLKAVDECGSLSKAAAKQRISYRKAWGDIRKAETRIGRRLLIRERGGARGGASRLTPYAEELLEAYAAFKDDIVRYSRTRFESGLHRFFD